MASKFPGWIKSAVRNGVDEAFTTEVMRRADADDLTPRDVRILLLVRLGGPVEAMRHRVLDYVQDRPWMATSVLANDRQVTGARFEDEVRCRVNSGADEYEVRTLHYGNDGVIASQWCTSPRKKDATQAAHLDLIAKRVATAGEQRDRPVSVRSEADSPHASHDCRDDAARHIPASAAEALVEPLTPRRALRQRTPPSAAPASVVGEVLSGGGDVVFDPGGAVGQGVFLCLPPAASPPFPNTVRRTIVLPDGQLVEFDGIRADILDFVGLAGRDDTTGWSTSARLWEQVVELVMHMIGEGRILPTIAEARARTDRQPTWHIAPPNPSLRRDIQRLGEDLAAQPLCWDRDDADSRLYHPVDHVHSCMDAVADRFVPSAGFANILPDTPFAALAQFGDPIRPLWDWADELAESRDTTPSVHVVLRINEPLRGNPEVLPVSLHLSTLFRSVDATVAARDVWNREVDFPGYDSWLRRRVTRVLRRAARVVPSLRQLGELAYPENFFLPVNDAVDLRGQAGQQLRDMGIAIEWHKDWASSLTRRVVVGLGSAAPIADGRLGLAEVLDRRWQFMLDGEPLSDAELQDLAASQLPIVWLHNRWVMVDPRDIAAQAHRRLSPANIGQGLLDAINGTIVVDGETFACTAADGLSELITGLRASIDKPLPSLPHVPALLPHQRRALGWLMRITDRGFGALLADDMGLGKTRTVLAFHLARQSHATKPTLVIVPTSVMKTWTDEIREHAGHIQLTCYHGTRRSMAGIGSDSLVLSTYAMLRQDFESFHQQDWGLVVLDEAQRIKNRRSNTATLARELPATTRIAVTGTPIENRLEDLWSLLDWCHPGVFGTWAQFNARYVRPIQQAHGGDKTELRRRFHELHRPFMLRRLKADIPEITLPAKTDHPHYVQMSKQQIGCKETLATELETEAAIGRHIERRGELTLKSHMQFRKLANSLDHYTGADPINAVRDVALAEQRAPKLAKLREILCPIRESGKHALVFTPFAYIARLLHAYTTNCGFTSFLYHGKLRDRERDATIEAFNSHDASLLICTIQTGGVGLNLTRANHVIHFDQHWNPALRSQANDRVHRLGQTRAINIHYLHSLHSIDERIKALLERKQALLDEYASTGEMQARFIAVAELKALHSGVMWQ